MNFVIGKSAVTIRAAFAGSDNINESDCRCTCKLPTIFLVYSNHIGGGSLFARYYSIESKQINNYYALHALGSSALHWYCTRVCTRLIDAMHSFLRRKILCRTTCRSIGVHLVIALRNPFSTDDGDQGKGQSFRQSRKVFTSFYVKHANRTMEILPKTFNE